MSPELHNTVVCWDADQLGARGGVNHSEKQGDFTPFFYNDVGELFTYPHLDVPDLNQCVMIAAFIAPYASGVLPGGVPHSLTDLYDVMCMASEEHA